MSYIYRVNNDRPYAAWYFDDGLIDFSGNGRDIEWDGTSEPTSPLIANGYGGLRLLNGGSIQYPAPPQYRPSNERRAFTLEAWVRVTAGVQSNIFSHVDENDGLFFDGTQFVFLNRYYSQDISVVYKPFNPNRVFHLVAVHTSEKNMLYVDGVLVSEASTVNEDYLSGIDYSSLFSRHDSNERFVVEGQAIYVKALSDEDIRSHYELGRRVDRAEDIVVRNGGVPLDFSDQNASIIYDNTDYSIQGDADNEWQTGVLVTDTPNGRIDGSKIEWSSTGSPITVEASVDDQNWFVCTNGTTIPGVTRQENVDTVVVDLRVRFTGPAVVDYLRTVVYDSKNIDAGNTTVMATVFDPADLSSEDFQPIDDNGRRGVRLRGGSVRIDLQDNYETVEFWAKFDTLTETRTLFSRSGSGSAIVTDSTLNSSLNMYVNGVRAESILLKSNEWTHFVFVTPSSTNPVTVDAPSVGMVALYPRSFTAEEVYDLYTDYYGNESLIVRDATTVNVSESDTSYLIYDYDWSVVTTR